MAHSFSRHLEVESRSLMESGEVVEIKRHFGVVAEGLQSQIRLVAESVSALGGRFDVFRQEMREEFDSTRVMIRSTYSELDQRLRLLEGE